MKYKWSDLYVYISTMKKKLDSNRVLHPFSDNDYWTVKDYDEDEIQLLRHGLPVANIRFEDVETLPNGDTKADVFLIKIDKETTQPNYADWTQCKFGDKIEAGLVTSRFFGINGRIFAGVLEDMISKRISYNEAVIESLPVKKRAGLVPSMM